jgi:hypothetical protein
MRNRSLLFSLIILIIVVLSGCTYGSYSSVGSVEINLPGKMSMSYSKFNGYKATPIHVKKGEPIDVNVNIVSKEGKINVSITDEKDKYIYQGKDIPTSSFVVTLDKEGDYKIRVDGAKHSGSYKITWGKADPKK